MYISYQKLISYNKNIGGGGEGGEGGRDYTDIWFLPCVYMQGREILFTNGIGKTNPSLGCLFVQSLFLFTVYLETLRDNGKKGEGGGVGVGRGGGTRQIFDFSHVLIKCRAVKY